MIDVIRYCQFSCYSIDLQWMQSTLLWCRRITELDLGTFFSTEFDLSVGFVKQLHILEFEHENEQADDPCMHVCPHTSLELYM